MTRSSLRALLRRVARLLEQEAKVTRESCAGVDRAWACDNCDGRTCSMRKSYDRHIATAKELRDAAVKGIRG